MAQDPQKERRTTPDPDASDAAAPHYEPPAVVQSLVFDNVVLAQTFCDDELCSTIDDEC